MSFPLTLFTNRLPYEILIDSLSYIWGIRDGIFVYQGTALPSQKKPPLGPLSGSVAAQTTFKLIYLVPYSVSIY
jgi:hypothetical protein